MDWFFRFIAAGNCAFAGTFAWRYARDGDPTDLGWCVFIGLAAICIMLGIIIDAIKDGQKGDRARKGE